MGDTALRYRIEGCRDGAAETIMLSSGLGGVGAYWQPQLVALGAAFRLAVYDHRGTGQNAEALGRDHGIVDMADDALRIMDDAGLSRCHFIGHALGGLIGLALSMRAPDRVASLVVVNGWAKIDPHTMRCFEMRSNLLRDSGLAAFIRAQPIFLYPAAWLADHAKRMAEEEAHAMAHFQGAENWRRRVAAASAFDISSALPALQPRTLILATRDDVLVPYQRSQMLAAGIPSATLAITDRGGHAMNVTETDDFNATVLDFLCRG